MYKDKINIFSLPLLHFSSPTTERNQYKNLYLAYSPAPFFIQLYFVFVFTDTESYGTHHFEILYFHLI